MFLSRSIIILLIFFNSCIIANDLPLNLYWKGNLKQAIQLSNKMLADKQHRTTDELLNCYDFLAEYNLEQGHFDKYLFFVNQHFSLNKNSALDSAFFYVRTANYYHCFFNNDSANKFCEQAMFCFYRYKQLSKDSALTSRYYSYFGNASRNTRFVNLRWSDTALSFTNIVFLKALHHRRYATFLSDFIAREKNENRSLYYSKFLDHIKKARCYADLIFKDNSSLHIQIYNIWSLVELFKKRYEESRRLFELAVKVNKNENHVVNQFEFVRSISYHALMILNMYKSSKQPHYLFSAEKLLLQGIPHWESYYNEELEFSKIGFDDQYFINPYQKLVYIYSELFRLTGNKFYFVKCFQFVENIKHCTNHKNGNRLIDGYDKTYLSIQKLKAICKQTNSALINFFKTEAPNVTRALLILPDTALQCLISDQNQLHLDHELTEFNKKILTNDFKKFKTNFYELYKLCFKSIDSTLIKNKISKITVIPDVSMGFLNFDLLQTDSLLPFNKSALINKYKITYNINITSFINNYNNNICYNEIKLHVPNYEKTNYPVLSFSDRFKDKLNELFSVTYVDIKKFKTEFFTQNSLHHYIGHINSNAYSNEQTLFLENTNFESAQLYNKHVKGSTYILSGCGSNVGRTYLYNKVNSMPYNLLSHEASAVISANWQIDDEANADFLNTFYNYLQKGEKSSEAFYKTKLDFIKLNKPPAVWGAYFYFGNDFEIGSVNKALLIFSIGLLVSILLIVFKVRFRK